MAAPTNYINLDDALIGSRTLAELVAMSAAERANVLVYFGDLNEGLDADKDRSVTLDDLLNFVQSARADIDTVANLPTDDPDGSIRFVEETRLKFVKLSGTWAPMEPRIGSGWFGADGCDGNGFPTDPQSNTIYFHTGNQRWYFYSVGGDWM